MSHIVLPMYPGLALGSIVPASKVLLPGLLKRQVDLKADLALAEKAKESDKSSGTSTQLKILEHNEKIDELKRDVAEVSREIEKLKAEKKITFLEEALPLDWHLTKLEIVHAAFESETLEHIVFNSEGHVFNQVQNFVHKLLQGKSSSLIPEEDILKITQTVEGLLAKKTAVAVLGSFICLTKVKTMEPLVIRRGTRLTKDLVQQSGKMFILSGAVLGAVFLGTGRDTSTVLEKDQTKFLTNVTAVSFVTQGGLPTFPPELEKVNLWSVYTNWKTSLISNPHSGYPIAFRVRCLKDVLEENGVPTNKIYP